MKKFDIIDLSLKIIGMSMLPTLFNSLLLGVSSLFMQSSINGDGDFSSILLFPFVGYFILCLLVVFILLFRSKWIAGKIIKGEEASTPVLFNIDGNVLLEIAIIVICGITLLGIIPQLFDDLTKIFAPRNENSVFNVFQLHTFPFSSFIVITISILILFKRQRIAAALLNKKPPHIEIE